MGALASDGSQNVSATSGQRHIAITPSDSTVLVGIRALLWQTDGTAVVEDGAGTTITYTRFAGDSLEFAAVKVKAASTATLVGWTY